MHAIKQLKFYLLLILLQMGVALTLSAQTATRTLIRTGHLLDVKTGAEPAAHHWNRSNGLNAKAIRRH